MSNNNKPSFLNAEERAFEETNDEVISNAIATKGSAFGEALAGMFELIRATQILAMVDVATHNAGVDLKGATGLAVNLMARVSSRLCASLSKEDEAAVRSMAEGLAKRHNAAYEVFQG